MSYTEKPETVEAVQFTREIAESADRQNDAKYPASEKKKFREYDGFFADEELDGTHLSVIDPNEETLFGRYGVWCEREQKWKPLSLSMWSVRYGHDGTFDVYTDDAFNAKYVGKAVFAKEKEGQK